MLVNALQNITASSCHAEILFSSDKNIPGEAQNKKKPSQFFSTENDTWVSKCLIVSINNNTMKISANHKSPKFKERNERCDIISDAYTISE